MKVLVRNNSILLSFNKMLPHFYCAVQVQMSVSGILAAEDAWKLEEAAAMAGTWDGEKRLVSRYVLNLAFSFNLYMLEYHLASETETCNRCPNLTWECGHIDN